MIFSFKLPPVLITLSLIGVNRAFIPASKPQAVAFRGLCVVDTARNSKTDDRTSTSMRRPLTISSLSNSCKRLMAWRMGLRYECMSGSKRMDKHKAWHCSPSISKLSVSAQSPTSLEPVTTRRSTSTLEQITTSLFCDVEMHPSTQAAISNVLGYQNMTKVQAESIPISLTGSDVLTKAKTGTGKTLAFLVPVIERAAARGTGRGVSAIIISPTRELAQQIAAEAEQLISFHKLRLMCAVGGVSVNRDLNQLMMGPPDILVATPGRLNDLLANCKLGFDAQRLDTLVLDEADHLLQMGFRGLIEDILAKLPDKSERQTVLYSATMPADLRSIASLAMDEDYKVVDCVGDEEETHGNVPQRYSVVPMADVMPRLAATLTEARKDPDHKVIVFFVAARVVQACAELFNYMGYDVLETHSRKSQSYRERVSESFRNRKGVIMFTSDVSARGLDYPDVTQVVQVGMPADAAQYVHRLGRTARAGKGGSGLLLLMESEQVFLKEVADLPLEEDERMDPGTMVEGRFQVAEAKSKVSGETLQQAYVAWIGFYNSRLKRLRWTKEMLVLEANFWATQIWGLASPPALVDRTISKMGLTGTKGLIRDKRKSMTVGDASQSGREGGRGRGGRGGGRGGCGRGWAGGEQRQRQPFSSGTEGDGSGARARGGRGSGRGYPRSGNGSGRGGGKGRGRS